MYSKWRFFHAASAAFLAGALFLAPSAGLAADSVTVLVDKLDAAPQTSFLRNQGATLIAERDAYDVYEVPASTAKALQGQGLTPRPDFQQIELAARTINTSAAAAKSAAAPGRQMQLVQFPAPPTDEELQALEATGVEIVHYIPNNAYMVWLPGDGEAQRLWGAKSRGPRLRYVGDFLPTDAITPSLAAAATRQAKLDVVVQFYNFKGDSQGRTVSDDMFQAYRLASTIKGNEETVLDGRYTNVKLSVTPKALAELAEIPSVVNIHLDRQREKFGERQGQSMASNLNPAGNGPAGPGYLNWLLGLGFSTDPADYPVVVIVDDGVDNGTTNPENSEFRVENNPGGASRVTFSMEPPGANNDGPAGRAGHGNINASIVMGYNNSTGPDFEDTSGFNYGLGISPFGRVANMKVFNDAGFFNAGSSETGMVREKYVRGARVSSNSWGADASGEYTTDSQLYDRLVRDADNQAAGNQEMTFVFSAGNSGPGSTTIGSPGTSKNVITVGAAESNNPDSSSGDGCGSGASDGNSILDVADFSSRGPTTDGRVKPDILVPGTFVMGAAPLTDFDGTGVCGPSSGLYFPPGTDYTWSSGTSHSCPGVAGYVSLIGEFLARVYGYGNLGGGVNEPSPALLKAYVLHATLHMTGTDGNDDLPSNEQGFGFADMGLGFSTAASRLLINQAEVLQTSGQVYEMTGRVDQSTEPIRVALAWTDAPGSTSGAAYVNDLDLQVIVGGQTYRGNNMTLDTSQPGGLPDTRNNAEAVYLPAGFSGSFTIRVIGTSIVGDGIPANGDTTDQDFALVAYNFSDITSAGSVEFSRGAYNCSDEVTVRVADADLINAGTATVQLTTNRGDSETITVSEDPVGTGAFVGTINTDSGAISTGSGVLNVQDGDTITLTYTDADDGEGGTNVPVTATADVDCAEPVISNVQVTEVGPRYAVITLETNETAAPLVEVGTACGSYTLAFDEASGTQHSVRVTGLLPETEYFFRVSATDTAENTALHDGGSCGSFTTLQQPEFFTEWFESGTLDLENSTITLEPSGGIDFYSACRQTGVTAFPSDPAGGTELNLDLDDFAPVTLSGRPLRLYNRTYGTFYISSKGYITGVEGEYTFEESFSSHFALPRVAAFFDDLDPSASGATVSYREFSDRVAITWENVPGFQRSDSNNFQIELFDDGRITITWLRMDQDDGLVGLSSGDGVPENFSESDLSAFFLCNSSQGQLRLVDSAMACDGSMEVELRDADLTGSTATITVATVDDSEAVTMNQIEAGIYRGTVSATVSAGANNDGLLNNAADGKEITVTYVDADDGLGGTNVNVVQETTFDCAPPAITGTEVREIIGTDAIIAFQTSELATGAIRYGTVCGSLPETTEGNPVATGSHQIRLRNLQPNTTYFFTAEATDLAGNSAFDDNGGTCYTFTTTDSLDFFTEAFSGGGADSNDMAFRQLIFTPIAGSNGYEVCQEFGISDFPTTPASATTLNLGDDDAELVTLTGGRSILHFNQEYSSVWVNSNGNITFGTADANTYQENPNSHFGLPRISLLFDDLDPSAGGSIRQQQLQDRLVITYLNVPEWSSSGGTGNNMQLELFWDGQIRLTILDITAADALVGLSRGSGLPDEFEESDLSSYGQCIYTGVADDVWQIYR